MYQCPQCRTQVNDGAVCPCQQPAQPVQQAQYQQPAQQYQPPQPQYQQPQAPQQTPYQPQAQQYQSPQPQNPYLQQPYQQPQQYYPPNMYQPMNPYLYPQVQAIQPGKTMIRVCGILLTTFASIGFIVNIFVMIAMFGTSAYSHLSSPMQYIAVYETFVSFAMLAGGIIGIALAEKKDKATLIMCVGIAIIALRIIDVICLVLFATAIVSAATIFGIIFGCILPLLYIVGGIQRKNAHQ